MTGAPAATAYPWRSLGPNVPRRGNGLTRGLSRLLLRLAGWRIVGTIPDLPKFVLIVAPHTSNWDFPVGLMARGAIGFRAEFLGKDTLFRPPLGWIMRWLGGHPVNRRHPQGVVGAIIGTIRSRSAFLLALAPEGTRRRVERWRTGFYHVALGAGIPIVPVAFDFGRREIVLHEAFWPTSDEPADLAALGEVYRGVTGRRPELFGQARGGD